MPLKLITGPALEPVTTAEVKSSARVDDTAYDAQATLAIAAMRSQAEARLARCLITQTLELILDDFPAGEIDLIIPDVLSITSVKYIDTTGVEQTLINTAYTLGEDSINADLFWLYPAQNVVWPATLGSANAVRIRFTAGYGATAADVPSDIRLWIIAHAVQILQSPDGYVEQKFSPLPYVDRLLHPHIIYRGV
jgi:uncharacterized phiE125 gp8 family phage protein